MTLDPVRAGEFLRRRLEAMSDPEFVELAARYSPELLELFPKRSAGDGRPVSRAGGDAVGASPAPAAGVSSPGRLADRMREYDRYVDSLGSHETGTLRPAEGETARAIALRISRAAKRRGRQVETRVVDDAVLVTAS